MKYLTYNGIAILKMSVTPLVHYMKIHLYYVDDLLIDVGPSAQKWQVRRALRGVNNFQASITHHHTDHAGLASWMEKKCGMRVFCDPSAPELARGKKHLSFFKKIFTGAGKPFLGKPFPEVIQTANYNFYPISTPGHTTDHVCLFEPNQGWLFTGDLYITPYSKVFSAEESMEDYIQSLEYIQTLDYHTVFCAHSGVIEDGKIMMGKKLSYLKSIKEEVTHLHHLGMSDVAIRKKIFPEKVKLEMISLGQFSRLNLIRSCYEAKKT